MFRVESLAGLDKNRVFTSPGFQPIITSGRARLTSKKAPTFVFTKDRAGNDAATENLLNNARESWRLQLRLVGRAADDLRKGEPNNETAGRHDALNVQVVLEKSTFTPNQIFLLRPRRH
jgi:hypothetical protein